jgi:hypothetical protein
MTKSEIVQERLSLNETERNLSNRGVKPSWTTVARKSQSAYRYIAAAVTETVCRCEIFALLSMSYCPVRDGESQKLQTGKICAPGLWYFFSPLAERRIDLFPTNLRNDKTSSGPTYLYVYIHVNFRWADSLWLKNIRSRLSKIPMCGTTLSMNQTELSDLQRKSIIRQFCRSVYWHPEFLVVALSRVGFIPDRCDLRRQ